MKRRPIFTLLFLTLALPVLAGYKYQNMDWSISFRGFYEFYGEYAYDKRDGRMHFSTFPPDQKLERYDSANPLYAKRPDLKPYPALEPNSHIDLFTEISNRNKSYLNFKIICDSSDDLIVSQYPLRLDRGRASINLDIMRLNLYVQEKIPAYDDPLEIFNPGRDEDFIIYNENPKRVFEWEGRDCLGGELVFQHKNEYFRVLAAKSISKWYWDEYKHESYYPSNWFLGYRFKYSLSGSFMFGSTFLRNSWWNKADSKDAEDHNSTIAFDCEAKLMDAVRFRAEMAKTIARYFTLANSPFGMGEAMRMEVLAEGQSAFLRMGYQYTGKNFEAYFARYKSNQEGYDLLFSLKTNPFIHFYSFDKFMMEPEKHDNYMIDLRNSVEIGSHPFWTRWNYQKLVLNNFEFDIWRSFMEIHVVKPELKIWVLRPVWFYSFYQYKRVDQPHEYSFVFESSSGVSEYKVVNYKPGEEHTISLEVGYEPTRKMTLKAGYKIMKNIIVRNLDEYLYYLERYDKLRELRPKLDDTAGYGDGSGYLISNSDDDNYDGDTLLHHFYDLSLAFQIFESSRIILEGLYNEWDTKLCLRFSSSF